MEGFRVFMKKNMKKTSFLVCIILCGVFAIFLSKKYCGSKPVIYAKVIAKKAESLLESDTINWADFDIKLKPMGGNYPQICREAKNKRKWLASKEVSEIGGYFETMLMDEIIPFWYGTKWDFYGHTDTPGVGEVACGYFVSTTLQHIGVGVNRYQLAQQTPENEAISLAADGEVIEVSGESSSENLAQIKKAVGDGICFVGLGRSHVGYLLKRKEELFFIHSSYFSPRAVIIELASKSPVFCAYDKYYIVELSNNKAFVQRWLNNESIEVIKNQ